MSDVHQAKIGSGHLAAMGRLGLRELRAATYPNSNVAQTPEYGLYGTLTPGEVAESRWEGGATMNEEPTQPASVLEDRLQQANAREPTERQPPEMGLDR